MNTFALINGLTDEIKKSQHLRHGTYVSKGRSPGQIGQTRGRSQDVLGGEGILPLAPLSNERWR